MHKVSLASPTLQLQEVSKGSARQESTKFTVNKQCRSNEIYLLWSYTVAVLYRPYAIPHVTKHITDSGQKSGYYAAILSGKEDRILWSVSTAKHFASSLRQRGMQVSLLR